MRSQPRRVKTVSWMASSSARAFVEAAADFGVFAFGVLAHDVKIDLARLEILYGRFHALQQAHRTQIHILLKSAPNGNQQSPQRNVIGYARIAHGAEKNCVERTKLFEAVFRHHAAGFEIGFATPIEVLPRNARIRTCLAAASTDSNALGNHFFSDAVAGNGCNLVVSVFGVGHLAVVLGCERRGEVRSYRVRAPGILRLRRSLPLS